MIVFLSGPTTTAEAACVSTRVVYRVVMSVGEVLNRGAITSVFVRVILSCVFESSRERVAARIGMTFFFANLFLSSVLPTLI